MDWCQIWQDVLATVIGGFIFAILLYLINEYIFKNPLLFGEELNGLWEVETITLKSNKAEYIDLKIEFNVHLIQVGNEIKGFGEKIREINPDNSILVYEFAKRPRIEISGYFEKNYFKRSKLHLLVEDYGRIRTTSSNYELTVYRKNMIGSFTSTAAKSNGNTTWKKINPNN